MAEFVEDFIAWPAMVKLAGCLCTTLAQRGLPELCRCSPVPGGQAILELCGSCNGEKGCGGMGWVRMVNEFPSREFPSPDTQGLCNAPRAYMLEVGIVRCQPTGTGNSIIGYQPPTLEQMVDATRLQMADKSAIVAAIQCCLNDADDEVSYSLGQYTTLTTGDCGGGMWTVTLWSV